MRIFMAFKCIDHSQNRLFPSSYNYYIPDNHLAKFIITIVKKLDLLPIEESYIGHGKEAYPPFMMLSLLIYAYITGSFSSRAIERHTYECLPYMYICCGEHPDHSTISDFRNRFAPSRKPRCWWRSITGIKPKI
jgi:transposase